MAWYPIKQGAVAARLHRRLVDAGVKRLLAAELCVHPDDSRAGLNGSGIVTVNPPWQFEQDLRQVLPLLHAALAERGAGRTRVAAPLRGLSGLRRPSRRRRRPSARRRRCRRCPGRRSRWCPAARAARRPGSPASSMRSGSATVRCRSISTVTGPSGVRTTRCGTTWPSNTQRAAKVTSPAPRTEPRAVGIEHFGERGRRERRRRLHRARLVGDVADRLRARSRRAGRLTSSTTPTATPATRLAAIANSRRRVAPCRPRAAGSTARARRVDGERATDDAVHRAQLVLVPGAGRALAAGAPRCRHPRRRARRPRGGGTRGRSIMAPPSGDRPSSLAQPRARAEQPRQHRALLHAHHVRDLPRRVTQQHLQHQRLAVFVVEAEDGVAHLLHALVLWRREHGRLGGDERVDVGELGPLLLEAARKLAAHDREQPGLVPCSRLPANRTTSTPATATPAPRPPRDPGPAPATRRNAAGPAGGSRTTLPKRRRRSVSPSPRFMYKDRP